MSASTALATVFGGPMVGLQVDQAERAKKDQNRALAEQRRAQEDARNAAVSQQRSNDMAYAAANRKKPNINSLLANEQLDSSIGAAATILSKRRNPLASASLLGG